MSPYSTFDMITAVWLGCVGACVGSFLNVVAYRMPRGISVIWEPSRCTLCRHLIRSYDNVPVLGWLWLRGKCRDCGAPISPRYAIVEFILGAAFFALAYVELFSGGANLPDGPITAMKGAEANVWRPQWKLIGIYTYHVLSLAWIVSMVLILFDRQRIPLKLIAFGTVLVALLELVGRPHIETGGICCLAIAAGLYNLRVEQPCGASDEEHSQDSPPVLEEASDVISLTAESTVPRTPGE